MKSTLSHRVETKTVTDLVNLYEDGALNLEPGFQRKSVWQMRDRAKLIESILRSYPLPAVFLYRRQERGQVIYDVIDGKQRLESILMFMGEIRGGRFGFKTQLDSGESVWMDWNYLRKKERQLEITGYRVPVIEVDGDISDIFDVFVRINSTGKPLTPQEKRHAKFFNSSFLREADRMSRRYQSVLMDMGVLSQGQIARMKHVELMCELMLSAHQGDVINRKAALDRVMAASSFSDSQIRRSSAQVVGALNRVRKMFPEIHTSRFRQMTDFYSLVVLVMKFEAEGMILTDRRRNSLAWDLLAAFGTEVDRVRESQRKAVGVKADQEIYRAYLLTVSQTSDDVNQRRKREGYLRGLLESLFAKKDAQRGFTSEQRRIMWSTSNQRKCVDCSRVLTWDDFTIDHVDPHSKGGRSTLNNAALMCQSCNSSKGPKRRRKS